MLIKDLFLKGSDLLPETINLIFGLCLLTIGIISSTKTFKASKLAKNKSAYYLELLGIIHLAKLNPVDISYGDKRKIMFIRSIVHEPDVLLLDEPTKGLDHHSRNKIWDIIDKFIPRKRDLFSTQKLFSFIVQ